MERCGSLPRVCPYPVLATTGQNGPPTYRVARMAQALISSIDEAAGWSPQHLQRTVSQRSASIAACRTLLARFSAAGLSDQLDVDDVGDAIAGVYLAEDQPLHSARSTGNLHLLVEGWAFRAQILPDGSRQITDIILPGDIGADPAAEAHSAEMEACGRVKIAVIKMGMLPQPVRSVIDKLQRRQEIDETRRLRAWLVGLGRRDARERMAYFMAETHARLAVMGLVQDNGFACPFTQEHLADILGLTAVHVNRTLARLRSEGLLIISRGHVAIGDLAGLCRIGGFEPVSNEVEDCRYGSVGS
jgi:CRP-like cAMP-binding protein